MTSHELRTVYPLRRLPDAASSTRRFILQGPQDVPHGSTYQLVLVDAVFFSNQPILETAVDRAARLLPQFLTRRTLLSALDLAHYCDRLRDYQCILWRNDQRIPETQMSLFTTQHGDYIRIWAPPMTSTCATPTRFAARCLQRGYDTGEVGNLFLESNPDDDGTQFVHVYSHRQSPHVLVRRSFLPSNKENSSFGRPPSS